MNQEKISEWKNENLHNLSRADNEVLETFKKRWEEKKRTSSLRRKNQLEAKKLRKDLAFAKRTPYAPLTESSRWTSEDELSFQLPTKLWQKGDRKPASNLEAEGILHAHFSLGNTHLNLRNFKGETILHSSAGAMKAWKKSSPVANYLLAHQSGQLALKKGIRRVIFESNGISRQRKIFFKGLKDSGLKILRIRLNPRLPHNGCRPPKKRRL